MNAEKTPYKKVVEKDTPMKEWLIDYVGEKEEPENEEVTVEMIVGTMVKEFPEFVFALAEENFLRGYEQALVDMQAVSEDMQQKLEEHQGEE